MDHTTHSRTPLASGFAGKCPRCGQGKLFDGWITLAKRCTVCDLDFGFADTGDGPAVFITFFAGFLVVGVALWMEVTFQPSYWVHALVSLPLILVSCLAPLRPLKGWLVARQYQMGALEVRNSEVSHAERAAVAPSAGPSPEKHDLTGSPRP
jgi:uncharacterized protein (DUF983 family)